MLSKNIFLLFMCRFISSPIKSVFLSFVLIFAALAATAQAHNAIYLETPGKNIIGPALMYERSAVSEHRLNLEGGAGLGLAMIGLDWSQQTIMTLPLYIGANLGRSHQKFAFGLAGFIPLGQYYRYIEDDGQMIKDTYVIPATLYLGYKRYPKADKGLYFQVNLQPLLNTSWIPVIPWAGVGIGYSFKNK